MEDHTIIDLYWARDQWVITASDEKYGAQCRAMSSRLLDSWEDGEECVNDTWHRAWNTMPPQRPGSLRAYLLKIVRNLSIDRWRAKQAQKRGGSLESLTQELEECLPVVPSAEEETEARLVTACVEGWLAGLNRDDRAVFVRRYWHGIQVNEMAAQWNCTSNAMAQRLRRLRAGLRRALEQEGIVV